MQELLSLSIWIILALPLVLFLTTRTPLYVYLFVYVLVLNGVILLTKHVTGKYTHPMFHRPQGATRCDLLHTSNDQSGLPGFPSAHVATAFFTLFACAAMLETWWAWSIAVAWTIAMAWSREKMKCHSRPQVVAGLVYGLIAYAIFIMYMQHRPLIQDPQGTVAFEFRSR